jgi:phytoene dehydrogenase-like protein
VNHEIGDEYDVIIIGAGIAGLVCGCYLAKAGIKVLIAEQHHKPGGYCTSFKRGVYTFDAAAHSFGSYRPGGNMRLIVEALDLDKTLKIKRYVPSDIISTPDYKITFWPDLDRTIEELQSAFPNEAENVRKFIQHLASSKPIDFVMLRKKTFKEFLDQYFQDEHLKAILALPSFGNGALPPSLISAFTGSKIFTEFILDGGYYPVGGMQALPDSLTERFRVLGGKLLLSCLVKKIRVKDNKVAGVVLEKYGFIPSKHVISACDTVQTFFKLLGKKAINKDVQQTIDNMIPSLSTFIVYIGIDKSFDALPNPGTNLWYLPHYDLEKIFVSAKKGDLEGVGGYMVRFSPDEKTILAFVNAPFKNKKYWDTNKAKSLETFIGRIEKHTIPHLSEHINYKDAATPYTLYRYTLNYKGAAYGWASLPSQLFTPELRQATSIKGLFLCGHWTTQTQGIPGAAYLGLDTAKLILKKEKINIS